MKIVNFRIAELPINEDRNRYNDAQHHDGNYGHENRRNDRDFGQQSSNYRGNSDREENRFSDYRSRMDEENRDGYGSESQRRTQRYNNPNSGGNRSDNYGRTGRRD